MGTISFTLPAEPPLPPTELAGGATLTGNYDRMPVPTQAEASDGRLRLTKDGDESGYVILPWDVDGFGRLAVSTATVAERNATYRLVVELARGKIYQIRNQAGEWATLGLLTPPGFDDTLKAATEDLRRAIMADAEGESDAPAKASLDAAHRAADMLVGAYIEQIVQARRHRQGPMSSKLSARIHGRPGVLADPLARLTFDRVAVPMTWRQVEPSESQYNWAAVDEALAWAEEAEVEAVGGPLIDFSASGLPDWLLTWADDPTSLASFVCDFVGTAVARYRGRIRRWTVCAAANGGGVLRIGEEDRLRLTAQLMEAALQIDPDLELVLGVSQPWGEYMKAEGHTYSPAVFADTILRTGLPVAGVEVEYLAGCSPRGSHCRDLLDFSRMLDLFHLLGLPLQVCLGYPSSGGLDVEADSHQRLGAGHWSGGYTPEAQADWAKRFAAIALAKPFVDGVVWGHLSDESTHILPHGGLVDARGAVKPSFQALREVRETYIA